MLGKKIPGSHKLVFDTLEASLGPQLGNRTYINIVFQAMQINQQIRKEIG